MARAAAEGRQLLPSRLDAVVLPLRGDRPHELEVPPGIPIVAIPDGDRDE